MSKPGLSKPGLSKPDPMEAGVRDALTQIGITFTEPSPLNLDFYLPDYGVHVEVKQFHSDRIAEQMSRAENVIALQGRAAVNLFIAMLYDGGKRR